METVDIVILEGWGGRGTVGEEYHFCFVSFCWGVFYVRRVLTLKEMNTRTYGMNVYFVVAEVVLTHTGTGTETGCFAWLGEGRRKTGKCDSY